MVRKREVSGGGRAVEVTPDRLERWFARFAERNDGVLSTRLDPEQVLVRGGNGTTATVAVPFAPLTPPGGTGQAEGLAVQPLVEHLRRPRRLGLVLVRLGGHSIGIAEQGRVLVSRTDRRLVHGRNSAGGWSQQRFARRREGQARQALAAAAEDVLEVLGSRLSELDAVVLGGDRRALDDLRADRRLAPLFALAEPRVLEVSEPRRSVLEEAAERAQAVEVVVRDG
ncbi:acVLRF1 family peptidyl-tRNA hydrolase [Amycolatopsis aidingensis]|uniref:acVLRF1 family peptidyl-tRNA hydrolase n=1 Tax=Amycolatopsis aidingensis TaxID=2842453 RepID=UPI001C0B0C31|nr:acVLRF1 family peptidyl-tRNA hydrolase [Amycolatopsis aidingensis]